MYMCFTDWDFSTLYLQGEIMIYYIPHLFVTCWLFSIQQFNFDHIWLLLLTVTKSQLTKLTRNLSLYQILGTVLFDVLSLSPNVWPLSHIWSEKIHQHNVNDMLDDFKGALETYIYQTNQCIFIENISWKTMFPFLHTTNI